MPGLHGGRVRTAGLARGLAVAGADVTVLCPWHHRQRASDPSLGAVRLHVHHWPASLLPPLAHRLAPPQVLLSLQPLALGPRQALRRLGGFDVVQFEFCAHARWLELVPPGAHTVYSAHNVERDLLRIEASRHLLAEASQRRLEALERTLVQGADLTVACSQEDSRRMADLYGPHRSSVIPNGSDLHLDENERRALRGGARRSLGLAPSERALLFVGGDAEHNRDAVRFLVRRVAPELGASVRLVLAGRSASAAGARHPRVRVVGWTKDLRPLLAAADVGLNPVAWGGGSSVKVADYLRAGLPVVATEVGARGQRHGNGTVIIASRESFAQVLSGELPKPELAGEAPAGWAQLGALLYGELSGLAAGRPRSDVV